MLQKFVIIFIVYGLISQSVVNSAEKLLDGSPFLVMRDGKPYTKGILQGYDENDQPIWTYFDDTVCEWLFKESGVACEQLPEEEVTSKSKYQIPIYTGEKKHDEV